MSTKTIYITLNALDCPNCGITFAITEEYEKRRRNDHASFYCPNGHSLSYNGKSKAEREADEARREAERLRQRLDSERATADFWREEQARERKAHAATKGKLTKTKNRAAKGVCPVSGCKRSFLDVARHIATQHPDYTPDGHSHA